MQLGITRRGVRSSRLSDHCVVCSTKEKPKPAEPGKMVCFKDSGRILRYLRELEEYLPTLSLLKSPPGITEYSAPVFGSRSPANDSAIVHTDWRSESSNLTGEMDGGMGALGVVASWARAVREERGLEGPQRATLTTEVTCLRSNHDWITAQPFVDEYAKELRDVHGMVRSLAHDPVPRPVGKCIRFKGNVECKGDVFELDDASGVRCSRCGDVYTGLDLDRLRVAQEA